MIIVVLAGGVGEGLWPISRKDFPKQFMSVANEKSFFYKTIKRSVSIAGRKNVYVSTIKDYYFYVKEVLDKFGISELNIIVEPLAKNTGVSVLYAIMWLEKFRNKNTRTKILFCPSDSHIENAGKFKKNIKEFSKIINKNEILVFGVKPIMPLRDYGYIKLGKKDNRNLFRLVSFVEKPSLQKAKGMIANKNWLWNTGMFLGELDSIKSLYINRCSGVFKRFKNIDFGNQKKIATLFKQIKPFIIDDVLFKNKKNPDIYIAISQFKHLDINDWDVFYKSCPKDNKDNVLIGDVFCHNLNNSLVLTEKNLVVCSNMKDVSVIACDDVVYIGKKTDSDSLKSVLHLLKRKNRKEAVERTTTYRPWGKYTILEESESYKIKKIAVYPGESLSLQMHNYRSEHWVVIKGTASVRIGNKEIVLKKGESTFVPLKSMHQLRNPGKDILEIIEVQMGNYVGEDDIVRFEDKYGRK